MIERAQEYGYLETRLVARYPDRHITFRNLGWSGDTVFGDARAGFGTAVSDDAALRWRPAHSMVSGLLPLDSIPRLVLRAGTPGFGFARFEIDVLEAGRVSLGLTSIDRLSLWVGELRVELEDPVALDLPAGRHTLTLAIDKSERVDGVVCRLERPSGASALARPVIGK